MWPNNNEQSASDERKRDFLDPTFYALDFLNLKLFGANGIEITTFPPFFGVTNMPRRYMKESKYLLRNLHYSILPQRQVKYEIHCGIAPRLIDKKVLHFDLNFPYTEDSQRTQTR